MCSGPCKGSLCGHIGKLGAFEGVVSVYCVVVLVKVYYR